MTDTRFGRRDPNTRGYYGEYGGKFVPETLVAPVEELEHAYLDARKDETFLAEFDRLLAHYVGRPTPVYEAARLREMLPKPAARIFLKREDLAHTGAHKINNALGQALLAAHGEEACHCRDGSWTARRRNGHRVRSARTRVRRLYGHR